MNITDKFLSFIFSINNETIPESSKRKIKYFLIDTLGVTIAGAKDLRNKDKELIKLWAIEENSYYPIGLDFGTSLANSIFINGLNAHFLELDDGIRYGVLHPSAPLFSVLIPLAIKYKISWENFVKAAACGYETGIRLAYSMQPSHYIKGYHPTAISSVPAIAIAIGILLNWDKKTIKDAFGTACISASGTLKVLEDVSQLKPYNSAQASLNGFISAMFAKAGFRSSNDPLGGKDGFLNMFSDSFDEKILLDKKEYLYLDKIYQKPYASCRHTHPEIEACIELRKHPDFNLDLIDKINVKTYKGVIGKHDGKKIEGESSARMSIPYSMAVALVTGKAGIDEFMDPYFSNPVIKNIINIIEISADEGFTSQVPDKRIALVNISLKNGSEFSKKIDYPKGEPENPFDVSELYEKFIMLSRYAGLDEFIAKSIFDEILFSENPELSRIIPKLKIDYGESSRTF